MTALILLTAFLSAIGVLVVAALRGTGEFADSVGKQSETHW